MISIRNLTKYYPNQYALCDLSLEIGAGETFGFIGPNGAGKTTTIRILATLLAPTGGDAYIGGHSVTEEPDVVHKLVGYMPDFFGVYDGITVQEYLEFFAAAFRIPRVEHPRLIADVLELTDLGSKRSAFIEHLSLGMRQRLCLAKTLLHDPQVLLLDEPAAGLDPRARADLKLLLRELSRMGKTIFISSHILPELADFCTSVGILEQGTLKLAGAMDAITSHLQQEGRILVLRVLGDPERAAAVLAAAPKVRDVTLQNGSGLIRCAYGGTLEEMADLVSHLVAEGVALVEFRQDSANLEDVFLRVTRGDVQ